MPVTVLIPLGFKYSHLDPFFKYPQPEGELKALIESRRVHAYCQIQFTVRRTINWKVERNDLGETVMESLGSITMLGFTASIRSDFMASFKNN